MDESWENKLISFITELIFSFNVNLIWQSSRRWIQVWLYRASWSCQIYQRSQKKLDRIYIQEYFALTSSKYFMMTLMCLYFLKSGMRVSCHNNIWTLAQGTRLLLMGVICQQRLKQFPKWNSFDPLYSGYIFCPRAGAGINIWEYKRRRKLIIQELWVEQSISGRNTCNKKPINNETLTIESSRGSSEADDLCFIGSLLWCVIF